MLRSLLSISSRLGSHQSHIRVIGTEFEQLAFIRLKLIITIVPFESKQVDVCSHKRSHPLGLSNAQTISDNFRLFVCNYKYQNDATICSASINHLIKFRKWFSMFAVCLFVYLLGSGDVCGGTIGG